MLSPPPREPAAGPWRVAPLAELTGLLLRDAPAGYAGWMAEENPFLLADRPWERAVAIVAGTPPLPYDPETEVVLGELLPVQAKHS